MVARCGFRYGLIPASCADANPYDGQLYLAGLRVWQSTGRGTAPFTACATLVNPSHALR